MRFIILQIIAIIIIYFLAFFYVLLSDNPYPAIFYIDLAVRVTTVVYESGRIPFNVSINIIIIIKLKNIDYSQARIAFRHLFLPSCSFLAFFLAYFFSDIFYDSFFF